MRRRYRSFRGETGSFLRKAICLVIFYFGLKFFSISMLDDLIITFIVTFSYVLTGFILRKIGFWRY